MFRIVREPTFTHDVSVFTPVDGGHREEKIKVTYRVIPTEEAAKFGDDEQGSRDFLRRVVKRIDDLADENDKPISWSDEVRELLLSMPHVRLALAAGYGAAVSKAKAGN